MNSPTASWNPWKTFVRATLLCLLFGVILFGISLKRIERLPLSRAPLKFQEQKAHASMWTLSKQFPGRMTWTDSRRRAADWLRTEFRKLGYEPKTMTFSEVIDGKEYTDLENIYVERRGKRRPDEIVVVLAHYDIAENTVEGAMDDASGVGVVLELARLFAQEDPDRTLLFLLTDSEEFGAFWGARSFARQFDRADQIVAAASLDFVAPGNQTTILVTTDGLQQGFTPLWLRELALDSIRSIGQDKAIDFLHIVELVARGLQLPASDHGALLQAGIPSFNWVGQNENFTHQMAYIHHTPNDVAEAIRPESMRDYGQAAERLVRSLDELPHIPKNFRDSSYWKITSQRYLPGWAVIILHILAFVPFLVYSIAKFRVMAQRFSLTEMRRALKHEAQMLGALLGALLLGYAMILLLPALQIITQYELHPATQKSKILFSPNFLALLLVGTCVTSVYWIFNRAFIVRPARARRKLWDRIQFQRASATTPSEAHAVAAQGEAALARLQGEREIRHAFHATALAAIIAVALAFNSHLAVLTLLPPAYLWTSLRGGRRIQDRALNFLLILGGTISLFAMIVVMSSIFHIGVAYWYIFLSAAYGLFSAYAVVAFLVLVAVMIRLIRNFVL